MLKRHLCLLLASLLVLDGCADQPAPAPTPSWTWLWPTPEPPTPTESPLSTPLPVLPSNVWASWALLDRNTGVVATTGGGTGTSTTESMIKVAIAAEYLRELEHIPRTPDTGEMDMLSRMIRDSDNDAAETLYRRGGGDQMLTKVLDVCELRASRTTPGWWSQTQLTAADAARLGMCIAAGRLASAEWVTWILGEMRSVRGDGLFGIIEARPHDEQDRPLAIKNGWNLRDDGWHVNCLAVADGWTLAVLTRYPAELGVRYGGLLCRSVAASIAPTTPAPASSTVPA